MGCCSSTSVLGGCEIRSGSSGSTDSASFGGGLVDINKASVEELQALPGIGKSRAAAIVKHRSLHGPFHDLEELLAVQGIGQAVGAKVAGLVSFASRQSPPPAAGRGAWTRQGSYEVLFFPDTKEDTGLRRLLQILAGATKQLDVAVFAIAHADLAVALVAAHKRGVSVRVITDDVQAKADASQVSRLTVAGIPVRTDASEKMHMHHKFIVLDGHNLLTGSLNWTVAAIKKSNENLVISSSDSLSRRFIEEFERMWSAFGSSRVSSSPPGCFEGDVAALFFPCVSDTNFQLIRTELQLARKSIDVAMFTFTSDPLADLLIAKHQSGVRLRVITDNKQSTVSGADAERLLKAGVPVRTDNSWYAMHHKFAVIDGCILINGSFNWTAQAAKGNQENCIIYRKAGVLADSFTKEFEDLWLKFALKK